MSINRFALLLTLLISACGVSTDSEDSGLDAELNPASDIAMSLPALDAMALPEGSAVIVPLDQSVLALDADALATLAAEGSLEHLLAALVLEDPVVGTELVDSQVLRTTTGQNFLVASDGDVTLIGEGTLVEVRDHDGLTLLVVDGLLES